MWEETKYKYFVSVLYLLYYFILLVLQNLFYGQPFTYLLHFNTNICTFYSFCDQTEFFHPNGTCVECTVCGPGEQLSEDCGFGDGGEGVCILCEEGKFSADTGVAPCMRCTQCNLLNRLETTVCSPANNAQCGQCLPGKSLFLSDRERRRCTQRKIRRPQREE
uniref:TNFR-Cys domain-containing protein n=1 Tax=Dicentrarchus labrax TaxID=13489 RepID=A0A8C4EUE2_DICLA